MTAHATRYVPRTLALVVTILFLLAAGPAASQSSPPAPTEMTGVRAMGLGEAFTGGASGAGALFYNPAGISSLMMYAVEGSYVYDQATGRNLVHASIVDGKSNPHLGGGLGYTFSVSPESAELADFKGHDFYGALSAPIVPGYLLIGLTGHYISYDQFGDDLANGFTLDVGLMATLGDFIAVGLSGRDLIEVSGANRNRQLRAGLSYRSAITHVGFDTVVDFGDDGADTSFAGGLELMVAQLVPLRVGYRYDGTVEHHVLSAGAGFRSPAAGLDVLFRQDLTQTDDRMFGLALNLYL